MKTYKKFGIAAAALAALACSVALTASAADGDVWSIRRASGGDHGTETLSMSDNPVTAGQKVKFKLRLLNRDPQANYTAHGGAASASTWDNRWYFKYVGAGGTNEAASAASLYPPKVGVWVSGRYQWADVESLAPVTYVSGGNEVVNYDFTDLICSYTAQPGDFGLLTLAAGSESAPVEAASDNEATTYCMKNSAYWGIYDKETTTNACNLKLTSQSEGAVSSYVTFPTDDNPKFVQDRDLSQAGIYIRTIDFDDYKFSDDVWRRIAANGTSSYVNNGNAKRAPALSIPGAVATDHTVTLYAWAEDESVAYMKDGVEYDFGGGVTRKVIHIPIAPADGEIKEIPGGIYAAGTAGQTTTIFLSATPTNIFRAGVMITNFVTKTVLIGEPEPPSIVVKPGGASDWTAVAGSPAEIVPITVELEGIASYARDLDVTVTAEMINSSADWKDFIGLSSTAAGDPNGTSATATIRAGTQSAFVYAYVKRASDDTSTSTKGISIKASITDAAAIADFSGGIIPGTLHILPSKPKITYPATDTIYYDVPAGEEFEMSFNVDDAVGELTGSYTLEYTLTGIWSTMNTKTLDVGVPSGTDNTLTTNLIFNTSFTNGLFRVKNQDGYMSDPIRLTVNVFAKPLVGATPYDHVGSDGNPSRTYNEGDNAKLTFTLGTPFALADAGYIFLVPQTDASSNLVNTTAFEQGVRIVRGQSATERQASLLLLDGAANTELRYEFEIWNTPTKTEAGAVRIGTGTDGYASGEITLYVENVMPAVEGVSMSDTPLFTNGGTMEAKAAKGVTKIFKVESVNEPSETVDLTNELFLTEWKFYEGGTVLFTTNVYGNPYLAEVPYAFHNSGTNKVTVKVKDKDMTEQQFKQSAAFTFYVDTLDEPTISMVPYSGGEFYFTEDQVGSINGRVYVNLNIAPTEPIEVEISVVRDGEDDGLTSDPVLNTNRLTFASGSTSKYFYFKELDGDATFTISAKVITQTQSVDPEKTWAQYYIPEEEGGYAMTVENNAPIIQGVADTNAVPAGLNVPARPISWAANDVLPDIREGMTATLTVEGSTFEIPITTTNASGTVYGQVRGSYSPTFTSAGLKTVTLVVADKNGKSDTRRYYYIVEPSKELYLHPIGPRRGGISPLSIKYFSTGDLGSGRVWADAGADPTISEFDQKWTYDPGVGSANVFAFGYRNGEEATGTLVPGKDYRLDKPGYITTGSDLYQADPILDSFFYCWILETKAEDGNWTGDYLGAIQPSVGTDAAATAKQVVGLPEYDSEAVVYEERHVTAIFSKEKYPKDNVGDINQDDIPDVYAAFVVWDGGSSDAGGGGGGRLFEVAGYDNDLKSLRNFNGDNDYLPSKTSAGGTLIPNISSHWATYGAPFTAYLELRGYGEGLNYRANTLSGRGRNSGGTWISERDFTEAESNAWDTVYHLDPDWTPENRTDPTVDDTDDDGLPDGYEYYIWYHAYVGWMEDGKLKRLEGSKFQLEDIAVGKKITPEEIAKAFNPNEYASNVDERDTDNDGLTDLEEFAIGTNPVHWDTDGDGISDYWEIMRGLNPLVVESDTTVPDTNPDKDYMAWAEVGKDYALLTLPDGRMFAVASNGKGLVDSSGEEPTIIEDGTNTVAAIPVYRYGNASSTLVPTNRGAWASTGTKFAMKGNEQAPFEEFTCIFKPLDAAPIDWGEDIDLSNVVVKLNQKLTLVHEQVRAQYGFDPRTAWGMNVNGYVCNRWDPNLNPIHARRAGESGRAVNTKAYSNLDEYLLLKYRYMTSGGSPNMDLSRSLSKDLSDWKKDGPSGIGKIFKAGTTNPNIRYADKTYGNYGSSSSADGEESGNLTTFTDKTHGADTDSDGVPDGWELYVGFNPNFKKDGILEVDGDTLALAREYAGTDSCNAYSNAVSLVAETDSDSETEVATIYKNHPGNSNGWFNKFFPTDPWSGDTDGDCIRDDTEGGSWKNVCVLNNAMSYSTDGNGLYSFTFIYGSPADDKTLCIRGGGMNPCSVDTDFDLLPDPWEMCHAGVRAQAGTLIGGSFSRAVTLICNRNDGLTGVETTSTDTNETSSAAGVYITAGMDATLGPREDNASFTGDAYTNPSFRDPRTRTIRNFDFDGDGLQNFQEYLVQALRHLRYDDSETPLMGSWMPDGSMSSRTFIGFLPMNYMDGETFYSQTKDAGFVGGGAWQFRELGYFARPPHEWDPTACIPRAMSNYGDATGYRIMLPPHGLSGGSRLDPLGYASTDPRMWDSDYDNMDDYYELFHGLNPLLGSVANTTPEGMPDLSGDVIARAYAGQICFWSNAWTGWPMMPQDWLSGEVAYRDIDAVKYPWMIGTPEADADGDGLRNGDEALVVNMTSPQPTHTDPTPLWLTDSTAPNKASYTSQYYLLDEEIFLFYPWPWTVSGQTGDGSYTSFLFSFEENEGYDTDRDGVPDGEEQLMTATPISDPLKFTDPDRRQALWFPGENSAAVSYSADYRRLNYAAYDLLRQFTVEAWICPEDVSRDQVILERVAVYGASTMSNNVAKLRANFRIGIRADGRLYGLFDTNDAVTSGEGPGTSFVLGTGLTANEWRHVVLAFNGSTLTLYMDGVAVGLAPTALIPANGLINFVEDAVPNMSNFPVLNNGYTAVPSAVVLGAQALDYNGIAISDKSAWSSYTNFYKGYIDEVRVWDGARPLADIVTDMKKRYSFDDVSSIRDSVYAAWAAGATRNDNDGKDNLPAELIAHYNFQTLPGATDSKYVAWEPSGFTKNVRNLGKVEGNNVPGDIYCGWWYETPVHSTVYTHYRLVPWIQNTVGHLPLMDGSAPDSQFWSEGFGGTTPASELGVDKILFPNTANPYPYSIFTMERRFHQFALERLRGYGLDANNARAKYEYELRTTIVGSSDLLPLGGAFAKRCESMWDGNGPADAWEMTGVDNNANGIPDWWEKYAIANYGAAAGFGWDTILTWDGREMTAREAYIRDLQRGMVPTGKSSGAVNGTFVDIADTDNDGLPDWWENLYGIRSQNGLDDADNDGLSNYAEYLISECFSKYGFPRVSPILSRTFAHEWDQKVPDYFLKVGLTYLGEMFADHDFMEDSWEDPFDPDYVSRFTSDPWVDSDDDGWSNYSEARSGTDPTKQFSLLLDGESLPESPTPTMRLKVVYSSIGNERLSAPLYIMAYPESSAQGAPDAVWSVSMTAPQQYTMNLGPNTGDIKTFNLGPGSVVPGSINVEFRDPNEFKHEAGGGGVWLHPSSTTWQLGVIEFLGEGTIDTAPLRRGSWGGDVGSVTYETGEMTLDLSKLQDYLYFDNTENVYKYSEPPVSNDWVRLNMAKSFVRVRWSGIVASGNGREWNTCLAMPNVSGRLREGKTVFEVFADKNGDGVWTPGEPYGMVTGVDVGWSGNSVAVELTDTAPQMPRINLQEAVATDGFDGQNLVTDRGVLGYLGPNEPVPIPGTDMPLPTMNDVHVRIALTKINGRAASSGSTPAYPNAVVFDQRLDLAANPLLTERNLVMATGRFDLEWAGLSSQATRLGITDSSLITNATYRIVIGDGTVSSSVANNSLAFAFVNVFDREQPKCSLLSPQGTIYTQPTFSWTCNSDIGKAYPAFRLRVYTAESGGTLIYDSGVRRAPARNLDGSYSWTAPIYPDMMTPNGQIFATTNNYFWTVSMLDAKFTSSLSTQGRREFRLEASGQLGKISDYGMIKAKVRYFGPGSVATSRTNGLIRVQAFTSPDFTGMPAGEAMVTGVSQRASVGDIDSNAVIIGLKEGTYYVRAFIDSNGDADWSNWESWGYGNYVGAVDAAASSALRGQAVVAATAFPFTPRQYTVAVGEEPPVAEIYIEDMDRDNDGLPDVWEYNKKSSLLTLGSPTGPTFFTKVNTNLASTVKAYTKLNASSSGQTYAPITLMNTILSGSDPAATAAAIDLLSAGSSNSGNVAVRIDSFSLTDGLALYITSDVQAADANDLSIFVTTDSADVKVILVASDSPDFANAKETVVKTITIAANAEKNETVSAEDLRAAIDAAGFGDAAFFKVKLEQ